MAHRPVLQDDEELSRLPARRSVKWAQGLALPCSDRNRAANCVRVRTPTLR